MTRPVRRALKNVALLLLSTLFSFLLLNLALNVKSWFSLSSPAFMGVVSETVTPNTISGYSWPPGKHRIAAAANTDIVYHCTFDVNATGYLSQRNYSFKKQGDNVFRIIVFGDSFTAGEYLPVSWVDTANKLIAEQNSEKSPVVELYSFAVDGGGILNWHSIFFKEILDKYEFDAVIFAALTDDFHRGFTVMSGTLGHNDTHFGRMDSIPQSLEEIHLFLSRQPELALLYTNEELDKAIAGAGKSSLRFSITAWRWAGWSDFAGIKKMAQAYLESLLLNRDSLKSYTDNPRILDESFLATRYKYLGQFKEILRECAVRGKPVLLSAIPDRRGTLRMIQYGDMNMGLDFDSHLDLVSFSRLYNLSYFEGYKVFDGVSVADLQGRYWLKHDNHWGQAGSDTFADRMANFILEKWLPAIRNNKLANNYNGDHIFNKQ